MASRFFATNFSPNAGKDIAHYKKIAVPKGLEVRVRALANFLVVYLLLILFPFAVEASTEQEKGAVLNGGCTQSVDCLQVAGSGGSLTAEKGRAFPLDESSEFSTSPIPVSDPVAEHPGIEPQDEPGQGTDGIENGMANDAGDDWDQLISALLTNLFWIFSGFIFGYVAEGVWLRLRRHRSSVKSPPATKSTERRSFLKRGVIILCGAMATLLPSIPPVASGPLIAPSVQPVPIRPTMVTAEWLNRMQTEIRDIICRHESKSEGAAMDLSEPPLQSHLQEDAGSHEPVHD